MRGPVGDKRMYEEDCTCGDSEETTEAVRAFLKRVDRMTGSFFVRFRYGSGCNRAEIDVSRNIDG